MRRRSKLNAFPIKKVAVTLNLTPEGLAGLLEMAKKEELPVEVFMQRLIDEALRYRLWESALREFQKSRQKVRVKKAAPRRMRKKN